MNKARLGKIAVIFICIILIISVFLLKARDKKQEQGRSNENQATENTAPPGSTAVAETPADDQASEGDISQYLDPDQLKKIDTSLYEEDASDSGETEKALFFGEETYEVLELPFDYWDALMKKLQLYTDLNIPDTIGEQKGIEGQIDVIPESIQEEGEAIQFTIDLNNGYELYIKITYSDQTITISDNGGIQ